NSYNRGSRGRKSGPALPTFRRRTWSRCRSESWSGWPDQVSSGPPHARLWCESARLFPLPTDAVLGVFEDDALVQKLLANAVSAGEIFRFFGLRSRCDPGLDLLVRERVFFSGRIQNIENGVEVIEQFERGPDHRGGEFARIHHGVGLAHIFEYG